MAQTGKDPEAPKPVEEQVREQTGQQQVRVHMDERNMKTSYANAFRTNATADEVVLDFGLSLAAPSSQQNQPEMVFQVNDRVVMNYYSVKRLAIALSQLVRRQEEQFGELQLDVNKRRRSGT